MKSLALLAALIASAPASRTEEPESRVYLLSIGGIALAQEERLTGFRIASWGVDWLALCRIPAGWRLRAGRAATPEGLLEGESTHGVTRLGDFEALRGVALVRVWGRLQWRDRHDGDAVFPAHFAGTLDLSGGRQVRLGQGELQLRPATACPPPG
jgi:hypothetical protein